MTKTIEFIEREIENSKKLLDRAIRYNLTICVKNETEKLQILEQIKCELEAWEVVAPILIANKRVDLGWLLKNHFEKAEKIIKALEVYDE